MPRLGSASLGERVVLALDRYEVLRPLDLWLQQTFVPALERQRPRRVRRPRGADGRLVDRHGSRCSGACRSATCRATMPRRCSGRTASTATTSSGSTASRAGHPLSLRLAAAALVAGPALDHEATTVTAIVEELTELYLAQPRSADPPGARRGVGRPAADALADGARCCPTPRRRTRSSACGSLPFVELSSDGLVLHDTVREVVAAYLRASDPDRSRRYRIAAWRLLRDEVTRATSHEMWRYTADLLYILENPAVREGFFPTSEHLYFVDPARGADWPAIREIAAASEPPESVAILRGLVAAPARRVLGGPRRRREASSGSTSLTQIERVPRALFDADPARPDLARPRPAFAGPARTARSSCIRGSSARTRRIPTSALVVAALILDLKRQYMELRPELRRDLQRPPGALRARVAVDHARLPERAPRRRYVRRGRVLRARPRLRARRRSTAG